MDYLQLPFTKSQYPFKEMQCTEDTHVHSIFIPVDALDTNACSFAQIKKNGRNQIYTTILSVFTHLVNGNKKLSQRSERSSDDDGDGDGDNSGGKQMEEDPEDDIPKPTMKNETRIVLEAIKNKGGVLIGFRFFIFNFNPEKYNYGLGVDNLIFENVERRSKKKRFTNDPDKPFHSVIDIVYWMSIICDTYLMRATAEEVACEVLDENATLKSYTNPCHPRNIFSLFNAMKICKAKYKDVIPLQVDYFKYVQDAGKYYTFPMPNCTWELPSDMFQLDVLQGCEFPVPGTITYEIKSPDYQLERQRALHLVYKPLSKETSFKDPSDIALLAVKNEFLLKQCKTNREKRMLREKTLLPEFKKVYKRENKMSKNIKTMLKWCSDLEKCTSAKGQVLTLQNPCKPIDAALSPFANMVALKFYEYEKILQTSTVHKELFIILVARLDAYRRSFKLHTNPLLAGQGSTSKSYILDCVDKLSIPGTVNVVTHETAKANAVDDNQNDLITFYHEVPLHMLGVDNGKTTQGDPTLKERLTSCTYKTKLYVVDEDTGKRYNRTAVSEMIGIIAGATNDPVAKIPEALRSRFLIIMCPNVYRENHNVIDYFASQKISKERVDKVVFKHQCEQFLVCLAEKMIWTGVLEDVNMSVAKLTFSKVLSELALKGVTNASSPRPFEFLLNTARTLTIMFAIHMVFNTEMSDVVQAGAIFNMDLMLKVQPYLFCTEEIAIFTLTLLGFQYVNPLEKEVVETIAELANYKPNESIKASDLVPSTDEFESDATMADVNTSTYNDVDCNIDFSYTTSADTHHPRTKVSERGEVIIEDENGNVQTDDSKLLKFKLLDVNKCDFNYVAFEITDSKKSSWPIAYDIHKTMNQTYKSSPQNIQMILEDFRSRKFLTFERSSHNFIEDMKPKVLKDLIEINADGSKRVHFLATFIDFIASQEKSILLDTIKNTFHKYSRERKIILGTTHMYNKLTLPHLLQTETVEKRQQLLIRHNPNFVDKDDADYDLVDHEENFISEVVDMCIEEFEFVKFVTNLGYDATRLEEWKQVCMKLPKNTEKLYTAYYSGNINNGIYPDAQIKKFRDAYVIRKRLNCSEPSENDKIKYSMSKKIKSSIEYV